MGGAGGGDFSVLGILFDIALFDHVFTSVYTFLGFTGNFTGFSEVLMIFVGHF